MLVEQTARVRRERAHKGARVGMARQWLLLLLPGRMGMGMRRRWRAGHLRLRRGVLGKGTLPMLPVRRMRVDVLLLVSVATIRVAFASLRRMG